VTEALDPYVRISALEAELVEANVELARLRASAPRGCGVPAHDGAAARVHELEHELATLGERSTRGQRTKARIEEQRRERLQAEIQRLTDQIAGLRPRVVGDRELLARLKAARQRRFVVEKLTHRSGGGTPAGVALDVAPVHADLAPVHDPIGHRSPMSSYLAIVATLTVVAAPVLPTAGALLAFALSAGLASFLALRSVFPGAGRDLVTDREIYGTPWTQVEWISFETDGRLVIRAGSRTHAFAPDLPAFKEVVRIALDAAASHSIRVTGTPDRPQLAPGSPSK
jgi:hypothetical protein